MIVVYTDPTLGTDREFDAELLTCGEADAVSRAVDVAWPAIGQALRSRSPQAMRGIAWAWLKREQPTLRFSHFDPLLKNLTTKFTTEEIPAFLDLLDRSNFTTAQREQAAAEVIAYAVDRDAARQAIADHAAPKAPETETPETAASPGSNAITEP